MVVVKSEASTIKGERNEKKDESKKIKNESKKINGESKKTKGESQKIKGESKKIKGESQKIKGESKKIKGGSQKIKGESKKRNDDEETTEKLTPYQGNTRTFGLFACTKCRHEWSSAHSWANMGQECWKCRINIYPRRQWKLKKKRGPRVKSGKAHMEELCEKCKTIGHLCVVLRTRSDNPD